MGNLNNTNQHSNKTLMEAPTLLHVPLKKTIYVPIEVISPSFPVLTDILKIDWKWVEKSLARTDSNKNCLKGFKRTLPKTKNKKLWSDLSLKGLLLADSYF